MAEEDQVDRSPRRVRRQVEEEEDNLLFSYSQGDYFCGATVINDRYRLLKSRNSLD